MVGTHGDEQHFGIVLRFPFQGFQQVEPPEGEELALCLAHGFREAAHRDGYPYHFLGFVLHHAHQVLVHQVQVLAHERVYLLAAQGGEAEDGCVGFVQEAEDALPVVAAGHVLVGEFLDFEVEHFLREACHACVLLGYFLGDVDAHLYPIYLLHVAVGFHMAGVVGEVVEGVHRAHAVEVGEEHPFLVEVGDAHRSLDGVHAAFVPPLGDGIEQGGGYIGIVHEVEVAEAHVACVPFLVDSVVDDGGDASHGFALAVVGDEGLHVGELKSRVLAWVEGVAHVCPQVGHVARAVLVEFFCHLHEVVHLSLRGYFGDSQVFHGGKITVLADEGRVLYFSFRVPFSDVWFLGRRIGKWGHLLAFCP